jgi:hypothetical protein
MNNERNAFRMVQLSYTPLLLSVSRLDDNAGDEANT